MLQTWFANLVCEGLKKFVVGIALLYKFGIGSCGKLLGLQHKLSQQLKVLRAKQSQQTTLLLFSHKQGIALLTLLGT